MRYYYLLGLCVFAFLFHSCWDDPDLHAYIGLDNNSNISITLSYIEVYPGCMQIPDWTGEECEKIETESTQGKNQWEDIIMHTADKILKPYTQCDNYLHYRREEWLGPGGWEKTGIGLLYLYIIDASEPNKDIKNKTYGVERLLGIYKLYPQDLKDIDFRVVYPPDETYIKYWIDP